MPNFQELENPLPQRPTAHEERNTGTCLSLSLASSERRPGPRLEEQPEVTQMKEKGTPMQVSPRAKHARGHFPWTLVGHAARWFVMSPHCAIYLLGSRSPKRIPKGLILFIFLYLPDFSRVLRTKRGGGEAFPSSVRTSMAFVDQLPFLWPFQSHLISALRTDEEGSFAHWGLRL